MMQTPSKPKNRKDSNPENRKLRAGYDPSQEKIRVIQQNLVFVSGLPHDLTSRDTLKNSLYFGRYGKVLKIIVNSSSNYKKTNGIQVYVTYETELQASLAIVALDGLNIADRPLKASYGTTKYCTHFLKGYECLNPQCFCLHKFQRDKQVIGSDHGTTFEQQNDQAFNIVQNNLEQVLEKISASQKNTNNGNQDFPTLMEMIDFLIESNIVSQNRVDQLIKKNSKDMQKQKSQPSTDQTKKISSNTCKQLKMAKNAITVSHNVQKPSLNHTVSQESLGCKQKQTEVVEPDLEEIMEKMIINKLFSSSSKNHSRFNFASGNKNERNHKDELYKIKGIVQKYLIASN